MKVYFLYQKMLNWIKTDMYKDNSWQIIDKLSGKLNSLAGHARQRTIN